MKKVLIICLTIIALGGIKSWAQDTNSSSSAEAVYAPNINSRSSNFPPALGLPILPQQGYYQMGDGEKILKMENFNKIPIEVLRKRERSINLKFWEEPCQSSVWFKELENKNPIKILDHIPKNTRLLGQVQREDLGELAPLEVIRRSLYYGKKVTNTSNVVIIAKGIPVAKGKNSGLGGSGVQSELNKQGNEVITVAGSGLFARSTGWIREGLEITILCYEDIPVLIASYDYCGGDDESRFEKIGEAINKALPKFEEHKNIYFVSYYKRGDRKSAFSKGKEGSYKVMDHVTPISTRGSERFMLTVPTFPSSPKLGDRIDVYIANPGFKVKQNPYPEGDSK